MHGRVCSPVCVQDIPEEEVKECLEKFCYYFVVECICVYIIAF